MAIRKILIEGEDELLRKRSRVVDKFDKRLWMLLDDMTETMYAADGAGLAAPQVGVLKRAVVIDVGEGLIEMINPEIIWQEGSIIRPEGCLSVPGRRGTVERPERLRMRYQDRKGRVHEMDGEGFLGMAMCHERDHLDGIVYIDKMIEDVTDQYEADVEEE